MPEIACSSDERSKIRLGIEGWCNIAGISLQAETPPLAGEEISQPDRSYTGPTLMRLAGRWRSITWRPLGIAISAAEEWSLAGGAESFAVPTPEEQLAEGEASHLLDAALAALQRVLPRLEEAERLYLQLALTGQPAREIAPLLGLPVADVHKLAQRVKKRLREEIGAEDAIKKWRLSV